MIKGIGLTIIISEIKQENSIRLFEEKFLMNLPNETLQESSQKYSKIPDAYKLEYFIAIDNNLSKENQLYQMHVLADNIASPWLIYFDKEGSNTELIFNKNEHTRFSQEIFSAIIWAHLQLIY